MLNAGFFYAAGQCYWNDRSLFFVAPTLNGIVRFLPHINAEANILALLSTHVRLYGAAAPCSPPCRATDASKTPGPAALEPCTGQ